MLRLAALVCIVMAYVTLAWLGYKHKALVEVVWVNSFMQFQFFAAGTLLALALHRRERRLSWAQRGLLVAGGTGLVVLSETWFHLFWPTAASLPGVVVGYAMMLVGCVAFFLAFVGAPLRAPAWMVYLGRISYGLYVVHGFTIGVEAAVLARVWTSGRYIVVLLAHVLTLVPTIMIAMLSFRYLEQPILKFKERFAYVKSGEEMRVA